MLSQPPMDLVICGHFALDTIIQHTPYSKKHSIGGGVTYGGLAASYYNPQARIGIVSRIGDDFKESYFQEFQARKIDLSGIVRKGSHSTRYLLDYHDNVRDLRILSRAPDIEMEDFPPHFLSAKAIHLTPIADEFPPIFLEQLANHHFTQEALIGIDVQGLIRAFDSAGNILIKNAHTDHIKIFNILRTYGSRMFFKASDQEALGVTHCTDLIEATEKLGETGAYIFTTLGAKGLYFKAPNQPVIHLNAYRPRRTVDETGAGDCFMAVLLVELSRIPTEERTEARIIRTAQIASAAASFLIEEPGPHGFQSRETVISRAVPENELR